MGGDYTRFTYDSLKDYCGVFKQQGRVSLDADWNELVEMMDRRSRAETMDILGAQGQGVVTSTTPDAFKVSIIDIRDIRGDGGWVLSIGTGRLYVDGLLIECHGTALTEYVIPLYDRYLGEQQKTDPVFYQHQPYLPGGPGGLARTPLSKKADITDLVYLDVWQREVTAIEDPDILEKALGGPDTTTRLQTVWQVGVLPLDHNSYHCDDQIPKWENITKPSAGRLTTSTVEFRETGDLCQTTPAGGFRGSENRLYRVEIHEEGGFGQAKFKYSRDNGSVVAAVEAIEGRTLTVRHLGNNSIPRFEVGDWIEVLDDYTELRTTLIPNGDGSKLQRQAGMMAQVTKVDEAKSTLTINGDINSDNIDCTDPKKLHTRVRRWDQQERVNGDELLTVTNQEIDLEDGIKIQFSLDPIGGQFKVGDYWVFAARTDGSVELLHNAPPRGILHHYCKLALIKWRKDEDPIIEDCRKKWPPSGCEGCCTVTVGDGINSKGQYSDLGEAIASLEDKGGTVCLGRGIFNVSNTITIQNKKNITIRGMGPATRIIFSGGETPLLEIKESQHITIEDIFVAGITLNPLIHLTKSHFCIIQNCTLANLRIPSGLFDIEDLGKAIALEERCTECSILDNVLVAAVTLYASKKVKNLLIQNNRILSLTASIFIRNAEGLKILNNYALGLNLPEFLAICKEQGQAASLDQTNIDNLQNRVYQAFQQGNLFTNSIQVFGIRIDSGFDVVLSGNRIGAAIGIAGTLLINAQISDNHIFSWIGICLIDGITIRVSNNFIGGLIFGLLQTGIGGAIGFVANLRCENNEWLGLNGIVLQPIKETLVYLESLKNSLQNDQNKNRLNELNQVLFNNFANTSNQARQSGTKAIAHNPLPMWAITLKIQGNVFLNFHAGIWSSKRVISKDISILDNTFWVCGISGVALLGNFSYLDAPNIVPLHLIQGNKFNVFGVGIISARSHTIIDSNNINCPKVAIELSGSNSAIRNNIIKGSQTQSNSSKDVYYGVYQRQYLTLGEKIYDKSDGVLIDNKDRESALIWIHDPYGDAVENLEISGNLIEGGAGHGILIKNTIQCHKNSIYNIENNIIQKMKSGIAIVLQNYKSGIQVIENTINDCESSVLIGIPYGEIKFIGNTIKSSCCSQPSVFIKGEEQDISAIIQNNYFNINESDSLFVWISGINYLHFQGNQSSHTVTEKLEKDIWASVILLGNNIIVNGNTVCCEGLQNKNNSSRQRVSVASCQDVIPHPVALIVDAKNNAIVTSNLVKGGYYGFHTTDDNPLNISNIQFYGETEVSEEYWKENSNIIF